MQFSARFQGMFTRNCLGRAKIELIIKRSHTIGPCNIGVPNDYQADLSEEDDDLCPVECVREFKTDKEFHRILDKATETGSLVVVDFFRTSCGSCKHIEQVSLNCARNPSVPLFHFYKNGVLGEAFATREKDRIIEALLKHSSIQPQDILS